PAGGCCFLTDAQYSVKLADLWQARGDKQYEMDDIMLLKVGRHIRPAPGYKLIISREEGEGNFLRGYRHQYAHLTTISHPGPLALIDGQFDDQELLLAARLVARYSQGRSAEQVTLEFTDIDGQARELTVEPLPAHEISKEWVL
ncbi:MAG: tRNA (5-methylaminomethyl-2-thiouridylate)-methyltransferase, partial [Candidatus Thiodiazotropha sp.]